MVSQGAEFFGSLTGRTFFLQRKMEDCLSPEELLSMAEFNENGDTKQLLAPDLANLSQARFLHQFTGGRSFFTS